MFAINTRLVRIHGFAPAELMFGYKPKGSWLRHLHEDYDTETEVKDPEDNAPHLCHMHIERRDKLREDARAAMAAVHQRMEKSRDPMWTKLKEGDLVLLWNAQLEKHLRRKLESRWTEPHRLVKINPGGVSGMVCKLYGNQDNLYRIHLDDMKVYCLQSQFQEGIAIPTTVSHSRDTMSCAGFPGQRALDLSGCW